MGDTFTFRCPPKVRARMQDVAKRSGASDLTDLLRRALAAYELLVDETEAGSKVLIERTEADGTKTLRELVVLG